MKAILVCVGLAAGFAAVGVPLLCRTDGEAPAPRKAKRLNYCPTEVAANGIVEGARPEVALRPEVPGRIAAIHARENQDVRRGDVLVELDSDTHRHEVALAAAELALARADLAKLRNGERKERLDAAGALESAKETLHHQARGEFERAQELLSRKSMSVEQYEAHRFRMLQTEAEWKQYRAELALLRAPPRPEDLAAAEARVAAAEARHQLAVARQAKTRVVAPFDGRILQVYAEPGEIAGPDNPQPVLLFADLSRRRVRAFVEELDISRVRTGQQVRITADALAGKEYAGVVALVLPRMGKRAPQSDTPGEYRDVYYREVLIDMTAAGEMPTNLRVQVRIAVGAGQAAPPPAPPR
ncbi:MAG: efflux RND transporter periplasmic adaptor subunit [Gemmataceae bacterium]|nr:efflux RND transporter periplasmic adaptor subunit [Gemmataceae bacterium]